MLTLYDPAFEHDACGVGMVADLTGQATNQTIRDALTILENLEHRGAAGADPASGDGAGILLQIPHVAVTSWFADVPAPGGYGIAAWMVSGTRADLRGAVDDAAARLGLARAGERPVPVDSTLLGPTSRSTEPQQVMHLLVPTGDLAGDRLELALFLLRRLVERSGVAYGVSASSRTLVYKGMLTAPQLRSYYRDLADDQLASAVAVVHSRFSTNTLPRWEQAHPFHFIAHNGEINTIRGNRNWMTARESTLAVPGWPVPLEEITPLVTPGRSDSATFDEVVELLVHGGRSLAHAVLMMIPEAWERSTTMDVARRDFYRYHAALMEPWDGPASVTFCDGRVVGAVLDRNGLRPARYWVTDDDRVILASEVGALPVDPAHVRAKGRLQPGRIFLVDLVAGRIVEDAEVKDALAHQAPYGRWLDDQQVSLDSVEPRPMLEPSFASVRRRQRTFGYSDEDLRLILAPMAATGEESIGSMGSDAALAVLSRRPRSIFDYVTQLFAQVTNPPLDAIREELVTATRVTIGGEENLFAAAPEHAHQIVLASPVLSSEDFAKLRYLDESERVHGFTPVVLDGLFPVDSDGVLGQVLADAITAVADAAVRAVRAGATIVILSDRPTSATLAPIPSLLLVTAVHHRLVAEHLRTRAALVVEAGDVREVHHVAALLGFGASAICPYLAYESIDALVAQGLLGSSTPFEARYQYAKALTKGVVKIMSKMGVSTVASYLGSELFEVVGLGPRLVAQFFPNLTSRIGGAELDRIAGDVRRWHRRAYRDEPRVGDPLENPGEYQWRRDGELHLFSPATVQKLQHATREGRYDIFQEYSRLVDDQSAGRLTLRSLLELRPAATPVPLDEVESEAAIIARFSTGAMSYGSISEEAHTTLAVAMNRLGARSNTGEGGEDERRYEVADPRANRRSAIKQVASGRFGVTSRYLVNADDLQIKMAQGAKPGEGGQLPGAKVYPWIAEVRHSTPGVGLISPPPHHDIYSIEDLKQLIYDLKNANDRARIHVKLVSEQGVGTIATGVAKAHADVILISGHDGGTGAAPLTSIKHAGTPWEIGLAEAHQALAANGLRSRVTLQVDGQLKTGRDVIIAALLGAEEFGFATAPLVVSGCVMMRVCHLDTCPVGIATQNPALRERFSGQPEFIEHFFSFVAREVREYLSVLGARRLDDIIGDAARLVATPDPVSGVDLGALVVTSAPDQRRRTRDQDHELGSALDWRFLDPALEAVREGRPFTYHGAVRNTDRTVGTLTGSAITRLLGATTLAPDSVVLDLVGSAGQSLGAFLPAGMTIRLTGDANDYVAKGLSGGRVVVVASPAAPFDPEHNIIAGNVIAYGATSGELFVTGIVGERCAVRNSGATVVVEGTGDHAGEYMTGGHLVILGPTGRNLAAGMSGGTIFLWDPDDRVHDALSAGVYEIDPLEAADEAVLVGILTRYAEDTGSRRARSLLENWRISRMHFVRIETSEYQRARDELRHG